MARRQTELQAEPARSARTRSRASTRRPQAVEVGDRAAVGQLLLRQPLPGYRRARCGGA